MFSLTQNNAFRPIATCQPKSGEILPENLIRHRRDACAGIASVEGASSYSFRPLHPSIQLHFPAPVVTQQQQQDDGESHNTQQYLLRQQ
jgi:hypothetical protein